MRSFIVFASLAILGCSSDDSSGDDEVANYAPCSGEPGACRLATVSVSQAGEQCLCQYYCEVDSDCPTPGTGSAVPSCTAFGDYVKDGHTASCTLPCNSSVTCPNGMVCQDGECWGIID